MRPIQLAARLILVRPTWVWCCFLYPAVVLVNGSASCSFNTQFEKDMTCLKLLTVDAGTCGSAEPRYDLSPRYLNLAPVSFYPSEL